MQKYLAVLALSSAFAAPTSTTPASVPFDADLFRRDTPVFSSHVEFLYWKVDEGALDYAISMNSPAWDASGTDNYAVGNMKRSIFNIDPGFRLGLSYFRAPHYWEVWAQYTRMTSRGHSHTSAPPEAGEYLTGTWPQLLDPNPIVRAETDLHLNYNVADFMADRYFNPNPHFRARLLGGLTGAWINQNWAIHYFDASSNHTDIHSRWLFGGVGLRLGTTLDWFWTNDIYLSARGTVAALLGYYRNKTKQTLSAGAGTGGQNTTLDPRNVSYSDARAATTLQMIVGPSYQKNFTNMRIEAFVGYELTTWTNLQEVYRSTSGAPYQAKETFINSGLLCLQGLTARLTMDY